MKCCVCGAESGHYPLCRACNQKKEQGLIIKCTQCGQWHYADAPCPQPNAPEFLYECRKSLITANEQQFFKALKEIVPPVSYTHLDVYKRQGRGRSGGEGRCDLPGY